MLLAIALLLNTASAEYCGKYVELWQRKDQKMVEFVVNRNPQAPSLEYGPFGKYPFFSEFRLSEKGFEFLFLYSSGNDGMSCAQQEDPKKLNCRIFVVDSGSKTSGKLDLPRNYGETV